MEWVTALIAAGCLFVAGQAVVDYRRHRRALEPRLECARTSGEQLRERMEAARRELEGRCGEDRGRHPPPRDRTPPPGEEAHGTGGEGLIDAGARLRGRPRLFA